MAHPALRIRMAVEIAQLLMQPLWNMWWMELLMNTLQIRAGKFDGSVDLAVFIKIRDFY